MSEPTTGVQAAAESTLATEVSGAAPTLPSSDAQSTSIEPKIDPVVPSKELGTKYPPLPSYALSYAPILWLHEEEMYWPGSPFEHLTHCVPQKKDGTKIDVPDDTLGKIGMLRLPGVDKEDTFLCLARDDPRINAKIEDLMSNKGRPDPHTRRSSSPVWIISVDKSKIVEPGVVDIFYFYFYPYNLGNTVAFTEFGNHVGDWEHTMVRFKNGQPIAVHCSAHADGHSWAWKTMEKMHGRPVAYVASGSHANYGKNGNHYYSGVPLVGPVDYTSKGVLWDPVLNYVAASYDCERETFSALSAAEPTSTSTAQPPAPGNVPAHAIAADLTSTSNPVIPAFNGTIPPEDVVTVLTFRGRWGNSFSDVRNPERASTLHQFISKVESKLDPGHKERHSLTQKLNMLIWAEGPSGPRWKSLDRKGVTWNTLDLLPSLV